MPDAEQWCKYFRQKYASLEIVPVPQSAPQSQPSPYTGASALIEALVDAGVSYLFVNLGSDHPGIVEALAQARATGKPVPKVITCPNEMVALTCAQGFVQIAGRAQAVLVHVDCGTQAMAGAIHNVAKCRVPVLIFAGASPYTQEGELKGSRNEFIHWLQDTADQAGIVRGYVKYAHEIRTGRNAQQLVHRALQIARSEQAGPAYLLAGREVMEETAPAGPGGQRQWWSPVAPMALAPQVTDEIAAALAGADAPLIVTSYLGRDRAAVAALTELCELAGIGVIESVPMWMNFPADHPLHLGYQWSSTTQNPLLADADVVLVAGSDVPWIPATNRPSPGARMYVLDIDPIKEQMTLWHVPAARYARADLATALRQVTARLREQGGLHGATVAARAKRLAAVHRAQREQWAARERPATARSPPSTWSPACGRRSARTPSCSPRRSPTTPSSASTCCPAGRDRSSAAAAARWAGPAARRSAPSWPRPTAPW